MRTALLELLICRRIHANEVDPRGRDVPHPIPGDALDMRLAYHRSPGQLLPLLQREYPYALGGPGTLCCQQGGIEQDCLTRVGATPRS